MNVVPIFWFILKSLSYGKISTKKTRINEQFWKILIKAKLGKKFIFKTWDWNIADSPWNFVPQSVSRRTRCWSALSGIKIIKLNIFNYAYYKNWNNKVSFPWESTATYDTVSWFVRSVRITSSLFKVSAGLWKRVSKGKKR